MYSVVVLQVILLFCGEGGKQLYSWDYLKYIVILIAPGLSRPPSSIGLEVLSSG